MQSERLFTGEELKAMGRRHVDKVIDAIESGDMEEAKMQAQRMYDECLAMHDGLVEWVASTLSFIGRRYGDEAVHDALKEGCKSWFEPFADKCKDASPKHRVKMLAKLLRGHMMPMTIEEDDEKFTIMMEPCGSGGRLALQNKYEPPCSYYKIVNPQPMTCGQKDLPVYCGHAGILSIIGIERGGAPVYYEEPSEQIGVKPCKIFVYKDPDDAPAELYAKVGKVKE